MANQNVDFTQVGATADTGEKEAAAIRPILNGEPGVAATFQRPDENLRVRTEIVRSAMEDAKYLHDADRNLLLHGGGSVLWNGTVISGGNGKFTITADMTLRPFLAPETSTKAKATIRGMSFETALAGAVVPRAYSGANKVTVQITGSDGAILGVALSGTPADNVVITVDTNAGSGTTKQQLVDYLNLNPAAGPTAYRALGLAAAIDGGTPTDKVSIDGPFGSTDTKMLAGAADAEKHVITAAGLVTFFTDAANVLAEGDVLAIWYDTLVNGSYGGRRESIGDLPENSANVDGNLFLLRRFPERMPLALPVARVVSGNLCFVDGSVLVKDIPAPLTGGMSELPPPTAIEPPARFLAMGLLGANTWDPLNDTEIVGGARAAVADTVARDAINAAYRKVGMIVYVVSNDTYYTLIGGITNGSWVQLQTDSRLTGGLHTVTWTYVNPTLMTAAAAAAAAIPSVRRTIGMIVHTYETATGLMELLSWNGSTFAANTSLLALGKHAVNWGRTYGLDVVNASTNLVGIQAGQYLCHDGLVVTLYAPETTVTVTGSQNIIWDRTDGTVKVVPRGDATAEDIVFAYANYSGGVLVKLVECTPRALVHAKVPGHVYVGDYDNSITGTHFNTLYHAMVWRCAFFGASDYQSGYRTFVFPAGAEYPINTFESMSGQVTALTSGAGVTITGNVNTRFLRDFAPGDWIRVGTRSAKVSSVSSDSSLAVVNLSSTIPTATSYSRCTWAGPHAWLVDLGLPEMAAIDDVRLIGEGAWGTGVPYSRLLWANDTMTGDPIVDAKPCINGTTNANGWELENLLLAYDGWTDTANHDIVHIKAPGSGWRARRCKFECVTYSATHLVHITTSILAADGPYPGLVFDECQFDGFEADSMFYDSNAAGSIGHIALIRCSMREGMSLFLFEFHASSLLDITTDDCEFQGVQSALVAQDLAGNWPARRVFRGGTISVAGSTVKAAKRNFGDVTDAQRVDFDNVTFLSGFNFTGTRFARASRVVGAMTIVLNSQGTFLGLDAGTGTVTGTPLSWVDHAGVARFATLSHTGASVIANKPLLISGTLTADKAMITGDLASGAKGLVATAVTNAQLHDVGLDINSRVRKLYINTVVTGLNQPLCVCPILENIASPFYIAAILNFKLAFMSTYMTDPHLAFGAIRGSLIVARNAVAPSNDEYVPNVTIDEQLARRILDSGAAQVDISAIGGNATLLTADLYSIGSTLAVRLLADYMSVDVGTTRDTRYVGEIEVVTIGDGSP